MRDREPEHVLLRSIREFRTALDALSGAGVSPIAEVSYLRILVRRYPGQAARFLAEDTGAASAAPPVTPPTGPPGAVRPRREASRARRGADERVPPGPPPAGGT